MGQCLEEKSVGQGNQPSSTERWEGDAHSRIGNWLPWKKSQ